MFLHQEHSGEPGNLPPGAASHHSDAVLDQGNSGTCGEDDLVAAEGLVRDFKCSVPQGMWGGLLGMTQGSGLGNFRVPWSHRRGAAQPGGDMELWSWNGCLTNHAQQVWGCGAAVPLRIPRNRQQMAAPHVRGQENGKNRAVLDTTTC
jgi:hypothetical protein